MTKRLKEARESFALGDLQYDQGLFENALLNYKAALLQYGSLDEREGVIRSYLAIGKSYLASGNGEKALTNYLWALPLAEDLNNQELIRDGENHLGNYYLSLNELDRAKEWYSRSGNISLAKSDVLSEYYRLGGTIAKREGDYERSLELYGQALEIDNSLINPSGIGINYYLQASAYSLMGNYSRAEEFLRQALEKDRFYENLPGIAADLSALATVFEKSGRLPEALLYYKRAYLAWKGLKRDEKVQEIVLKIENIGGEQIP